MNAISIPLSCVCFGIMTVGKKTVFKGNYSLGKIKEAISEGYN